MPQHPEFHIRRAVRVLSMVGELHKRGYQRLRVMLYIAPSGLAWRCTIAAADLLTVIMEQFLRKLVPSMMVIKRPQILHDTHLDKTTTISVGLMPSRTTPDRLLTSSCNAFRNSVTKGKALIMPMPAGTCGY